MTDTVKCTSCAAILEVTGSKILQGTKYLIYRCKKCRRQIIKRDE